MTMTRRGAARRRGDGRMGIGMGMGLGAESQGAWGCRKAERSWIQRLGLREERRWKWRIDGKDVERGNVEQERW